MANFVRGKVSKKKRRLVDKKNGFDLDLSYITKNIIAMGFPSEGSEGIYRNPYTEVVRFLDHFHKDHYKVYNLCSERGYDPSKFYNRVEVFPFDDHNAPQFDLIQKFCQNVEAWLAQSDQNIAVVHCKAGKGRTGLMICSWLLYNKEWTDPNDAMNFYAAMRTYNMKGVTIPSQIRYIKYFGIARLNGIPEMKTLYLNKLTFFKYPKISSSSDLRFTLYAYKTPIFRFKKNKKKEDGTVYEETEDKEKSLHSFDCGNLPVTGDIKVEVYEKSLTSKNLMFTFWFCTGFIENYHAKFEQSELDRANKDRNNKIYPKGFRVELSFKPPEGEVLKIEDGQKEVSSSSSSSGSLANASSNSKENKGKEAIKKSELAASSPKQVYKFSAITENGQTEGGAITPNDVAAGLLKDMICVYAKYSGENFDISTVETLPSISSSEDFPKITQAIHDLKKLDLHSLKKTNEKLAFWLNTYHLLLLHTRATSSQALPKSFDEWASTNRTKLYEIGGYTFTLLEIEQCVLRCVLSPPEGSKDYAVAKYKKTDPRYKFSIEKEDLRLPCVMSYGTTSSPVLYIYDPETLSTQLDERTRAYLIKHVTVSSDSSELVLPEILNVYGKDYGKKAKLLKWISEYLAPEHKKVVQGNKNINIKYEPFEWTLSIPLVHLYNIYVDFIDAEKQANEEEDDDD